MGGAVHVQQFAGPYVEDEQAVAAGIGQVERQLQVFAAVAQAPFDLFAQLRRAIQLQVGGAQYPGATGVFHGQAESGDQQQADQRGGPEHHFRQWGEQVRGQAVTGAEFQLEAVVAEQVQLRSQHRFMLAIRLLVGVDALAVFEHAHAEALAVRLCQQAFH
ncbi:hypothetical protein D9M71_189860 [compost metagenome]